MTKEFQSSTCQNQHPQIFAQSSAVFLVDRTPIIQKIIHHCPVVFIFLIIIIEFWLFSSFSESNALRKMICTVLYRLCPNKSTICKFCSFIRKRLKTHFTLHVNTFSSILWVCSVSFCLGNWTKSQLVALSGSLCQWNTQCIRLYLSFCKLSICSQECNSKSVYPPLSECGRVKVKWPYITNGHRYF